MLIIAVELEDLHRKVVRGRQVKGSFTLPPRNGLSIQRPAIDIILILPSLSQRHSSRTLLLDGEIRWLELLSRNIISKILSLVLDPDQKRDCLFIYVNY